LADDLEGFGIDPSDPLADFFRGTALFLLEKGFPREEILAMDTAARHALSWRLIFGPSGTPMTVPALAEAAGVTVEQVRTLIRALGFPDDTTSVFEMSDEDVEFFRLFDTAGQLLGEQAVLHLTRVIGGSMARIAEAATSMSRVSFETPLLRAEGTYLDFLHISDMMGSDFFPPLTEAFGRIFRYHILAGSTQAWGTDADQAAMTVSRAIGFADMVGFTEHAGSVSTKELVAILDDFEGRVTDAVVSAGGRVVKFIGDEVLFAFDDAAACCGCARSLLKLASEEAIREVRIGLTYGDIIARFGDLYGPVVNTVARLVDVAPPGAILVTPEIAQRAGDSFTFEPREPVKVKGIDRPVENLQLR
jgi:adenylate cyclase